VLGARLAGLSSVKFALVPLPTYFFCKKSQKTRPILNRIFELPSPRNAQKRDKKFKKKLALGFWSNFL
jgi:hypothetical protein